MDKGASPNFEGSITRLFEKGEKRGILQVQEPSSGTNPSKSVKIIECPVPILFSTALTNSVDVCTFVDSVMHDEYLHGQESISGGSLESELAKSPSPVPVDFPIKQHISEKSQDNSNQKKKELEKAPLTAEEQKV